MRKIKTNCIKNISFFLDLPPWVIYTQSDETWRCECTWRWPSHPASASKSWLCLRAVRVKSGRMATRLLSRPQWAAIRPGVTTATALAAGSSLWREPGEKAESLVSVSLWPVRHIRRRLIEMQFGWCTTATYTHTVRSNQAWNQVSVVTYHKSNLIIMSIGGVVVLEIGHGLTLSNGQRHFHKMLKKQYKMTCCCLI